MRQPSGVGRACSPRRPRRRIDPHLRSFARPNLSVLMREGAAVALPLLDAWDAEPKPKLRNNLPELRRVVEKHQHAHATVVFEDTISARNRECPRMRVP
jgi:hypothetical protein